MDTRQKQVVHEEHVFGPGYAPDLYVSKRLWATGVDGTAVPLSIVYRKDLLVMNQTVKEAVDIQSLSGMHTGTQSAIGNPLLLHGYGAYGSCIHPIFSTTRLSLLDRGFVYAVAHVRGGSDMGNGWYQEGKLNKKTNTFNDFIACAEFLIKVTARLRRLCDDRVIGGLYNS
jgi:oligopeptidase B